MKADEIIVELKKMFPEARCELNHRNNFELLIAVLLSAQTTDNAVNKVTPKLFKDFASVESFANADVRDIEKDIKSIGLYRNKALNIKKLANELIANFNGEVPSTMEELTSLSGVGRKTANVVMSECFNIPAIAVDTHVERISKRLRLAYANDSVLKVEEKLKRKIAKEDWINAHHLFIFFGRYKCKAKNPECSNCPFAYFCRKNI